VNVIFDFDYTLLPEESTVEILKLSLQARSDKNLLLAKLADIAPRALAGRANFKELFFLYRMTTHIRHSHVQQYILSRAPALDPRLARVIEQLKKDGVNLFILSGGYEEWIKPLAAKWGIKQENVVANRFYWWGKRVMGIQRSPLLSSSRGKPFVVNTWKSEFRLQGPTVIVGDGQADRAVWRCGAVEGFVAAQYYVNANLKTGSNMERATCIENLYMLITKLLATRVSPKTNLDTGETC